MMDDDLSRLEKIETRLALADSDARLNQLFTDHIQDLVRLISSPNTEVKSACTRILSHISTLIKSNNQLTLPTCALIQYLSHPLTHPVSRNFCLVYIDLALNRTLLNPKSPFCFNPISHPEQPLTMIMDLILALPAITQPHPLGVGSNGLAAFNCLSIIMTLATCVSINVFSPDLSNTYLKPKIPTDERVWSPVLLAFKNVLMHPKPIHGIPGPHWTKSKRALLTLFHAWIPSDLCPALVASVIVAGWCDPDDSVSSVAGNSWARLNMDSVVLENDAFIDSILNMYLAYCLNPPPTTTTDLSLTPYAQSLHQVSGKLRVLYLASKSKVAASAFPTLLKVVFDALFVVGTTLRLQQSGMAYLQWITESAKQPVLDRIAPVLVSGTLKVVKSDDQFTDVRVIGLALQALGTILDRVNTQFSPDILKSLFDLATKCSAQSSSELKYALIECLTCALRPLTPSWPHAHELTLMLAETDPRQHPSDVYRLLALRYAAKVLPSVLDPTLDLAMTLATTDSAPNIQLEANAFLDSLTNPTLLNRPTVQDLMDAASKVTDKYPVPKAWETLTNLVWMYVIVHGLGWVRNVPVDVLRTYTFAKKLHVWVTEHKELASQWIQWLVNGLQDPKVSTNGISSLLRYVYILQMLGAVLPPNMPMDHLVKLMTTTNSPTTQYRIRSLLPSTLNSSALPNTGGSNPAHQAASLLLNMSHVDAIQCLHTFIETTSKTGLAGSPATAFIAPISALLVIQQCLLSNVVFTEDQFKIMCTMIPQLINSKYATQDVIVHGLGTLAWTTFRSGGSTGPGYTILLKLLLKEIPDLAISRTSTTIPIAIGEAVSIVTAGQCATCIDLPYNQLVTDNKTGDDSFIIALIKAVEDAGPGTRKVLLSTLEPILVHVPHLANGIIDRIHEIAIRALSTPDLSLPASRVILAVHLDRTEVRSAKLLPSVSRALATLDAQTIAQSPALAVFSATIQSANEAKVSPEVACILVRQLVQHGLLDISEEGMTINESNDNASDTIFDQSLTLTHFVAHVGLVVPILFRMANHPISPIANAGKFLVRLLTDQKQGYPPLVDHYAKISEIISESLGHSAPIVRESGARALMDMINRDPTLAKSFLTESLSQASMRLLDDSHPVVQSAALRASSVLCRNLPAMLSVPLLLDALRSPAPPVSQFALNMLMSQCAGVDAPMITSINEETRVEHARVSNRARPWTRSELLPLIPTMIPSLLDALSSLEPQVLNYLSFHVASYDLTPAQLDARRLTLLQSSPVMATLEALMAMVTDTSDLEVLTSALVGVVRKGIGLPTRGGVGRMILLLRPTLLKESALSAGQLLKSLSGAIFDTNPTIRHVMAAAAAHIIGSGALTPEMLTKFLNHMIKQYSTGMADRRFMVSEVAQALVKTPGSRKSVGQVLHHWMPVVAIGMHASTPSPEPAGNTALGVDNEAKQWKATWTSFVNVDATAIEKYGPHIVLIAGEWLMQTQDWNLQDQLARTLDWLVTHQVALTKNQTSATSALQIADTTVQKLIEIAISHKREALIGSAVTVCAYSCNALDGKPTRDLTAWLVDKVSTSNRGHIMLTRLIQGLGLNSQRFITLHMYQSLVHAGYQHLVNSKRTIKPDLIVDTWECIAALVCAVGQVTNVSDLLGIVQVAVNSPNTHAVKSVHILTQVVPYLCCLDLDLINLIEIVAGFPGRVLNAGSIAGDQHGPLAVALIRLAGTLVGALPFEPHWALSTPSPHFTDSKKVRAVVPVIRTHLKTIIQSKTLAPLILDEASKVHANLPSL